ncbi:MAG: flagellar biosynthetic protein FliR [Eubacteriales bacterium]
MEDLILLDWGAFTLFLLIFMRMVGFVGLNPLFTLGSVPTIAKGGFTLFLAVMVFMMEGGRVEIPNNSLQLMVMMISELGVGMLISLVMNFFLAIPAIGGSIIDMQIGFSMAQAYDPATGSNSTVTGTILSAVMMMIFFAENGHHTLMRLMMTSGMIVPYGEAFFGEIMLELMIQLFLECMLLAVKLSMPIMAAELIAQVGMGILMKTIPQINVFAINIDLKVLIGLIMLIIYMPVISNYLLEIEITMLNSMQQALLSIAGRS